MVAKKRISIGLLTSALSEVLNKIFPLLVYAIAQRRLGIAGFGLAQYSISLVEVVIPLISLGSQYVGMQESGRQHAKGETRGSLMLPLFVIRSTHAFIIWTILLCFAFAYPPWTIYRSTLLWLSLLVLPLCNEAVSMLYGRQKISLFNGFQALSRVLILVLIYCFVRDPADVTFYVFLSLGANALINLWTLLWSRKYDNWAWPGAIVLRKLWLGSFRFGWPLLLLALQDRLDVFVVQHYFGEQGTGLYAGAMRIAQSLSNIVGPLAMVFYAETVGAIETGQQKQLQGLSFWFVSAITIPLALGGWFCSRDILLFIYGSNMADVTSVLQILLTLPMLYSFILILGIQNHLEPKRSIRTTIALFSGIISFLILSYLRHRTLVDIALAMVCGKLVAGFLIARELQWSDLKELFRPLGKIIISALLMSSVLWFLPSQNLLLKLSIGGSVYLGFLLYLEQSRWKALLKHRKFSLAVFKRRK